MSYQKLGDIFVDNVLPDDILTQKFIADEYEAFIVSQQLASRRS